MKEVKLPKSLPSYVYMKGSKEWLKDHLRVAYYLTCH